MGDVWKIVTLVKFTKLDIYNFTWFVNFLAVLSSMDPAML